MLGWLGRYGNGAQNLLPEWVDIATVIVFALLIFYWAVAAANSKPEAAAAIDRDAEQLRPVKMLLNGTYRGDGAPSIDQ